VKSAVETLNPTRVRLTVEVPFEELKPSLDGAYRRIGQQVQVPGFRRGKVPARLIDQRFGREVVLNEAVSEAVPRFYGQAVDEHKVKALGQPELDVTGFEDGGQLTFTAEVDVRPEIELPDYDGLEVTVDDATVTEADVDEHLSNLRERFAVLTGVQRPAQAGDFVSLDLVAASDGEVLEDGTASGLSYEVGSGTMIDGLDEAVTGRSAGESTTFRSALTGGEHAGRDVDVTVTVNSVKVKDLPELDDEFAQTASEFDTIDELRADLRTRIGQVKRLEQGASARDKVLEAALAQVEVPLPEAVVKAELDERRDSLAEQLQAAGLSREDYLESSGQKAGEFDRDIETRTRDAIKAQFVLDAVVAKEQLSVSQAELTEHLVLRAQRSGLAPEQFAQQLVQHNQVSAVVGEVARGKALTHLLRHAKVSDSSGNPVDIDALANEWEDADAATPADASEDTASADVTPAP
jgi:trigger factor